MSMPNKDKQMDQVMHKDATKIEHQKSKVMSTISGHIR